MTPQEKWDAEAGAYDGIEARPSESEEVRAPGPIDTRDGFGIAGMAANLPSEKQQSATPRTDAAYAEAYKGRDGEWITLTPDSKAWDFARQLERELAARDEELAQVSDMLQDARDAAQSATPQLTPHELAHLFEVIEDSGIKLEDGVWDKLTDAMRATEKRRKA